MILKNTRHALRLTAAGGLLLTTLMAGCKKPAVARLERTDNSVSSEAGGVPAAGKANRLLSEQSAFLRRHANDPVEWHPWGTEAFDKAKKENKPLLVSIGYASCPWSQKMHTESFTDGEIARFMNKHFVCVLVDREERPDVNTSFLNYAFWKQKLSGWPLHVWLTPDGLPIYQGIYFPAESAGSVPSWRLTLEHVSNNWESTPDYVKDQAQKSAEAYLNEFRRRWLGPPPGGSEESKEAKAFLTLSFQEQVKLFTSFSANDLQFAVTDLSTAKLKQIWEQLSPTTAAGIIAKLEAAAAAVLFAKFDGPVRESAFQQFVEQARQAGYQKLRSVFDPVYGGFGPPPRFAPHQSIDFLIRYAQRHRADTFGRQSNCMEMVSLTLDRMLAGGVHDQLGDGLHRYSTDIYWTVPQFEKMLYDQGYMAQALVSAGQLSGKKEYLQAAAGLLAYTGRELSHPEGGFYCAEGSSSPAKDGSMTEGAYYVWEKKEIDEIAGAAAPLIQSVFGIEQRGNLPLDSSMRGRLGNTNVLTIKQTPEQAAAALGITPAVARAQFTEASAKLFQARTKRTRPTLEDKVLTSWNGVAISGFARTGWALNDPALIQRGEKAANFILSKLRTKDGGLLHAFLDGPSPLPGYSEDYSTLITALLDLYEATGAAHWLATAKELQERQIKDLWDKQDGGFFDGPDSPLLFHRMKSMDEASEISAGSSSLLNLVVLSNTLNNIDYRDKARRIVERYGAHAALMPGAFVRFLRAADFLADPPPQLIVSALPDDPARKALIDVLRSVCRPGVPLIYMDGGESEKLVLQGVPDFAPLAAKAGEATVHFCRGFKPVKSLTTPAELAEFLKSHFSLPPAAL